MVPNMVRVLIFGLIICSTGVAQGQTRTYIGIRGGGQASSAYIAHTIFPINMDLTFLETAHAGVVFKHFNFRSNNPKALHAGFQSGINFIQRGWKQNFTTESGLQPYQTKLGYLEVPIEAILYWGQKRTKFFITMGLYYERLLTDRSKNRPTADQLESIRDDFFEYDPTRNDRQNGYGGRVAFGAFTDLPFGTIQLELFSSISFSGLFAFTNRTTAIPDQSNLYSIGLSAAYLFRFGKMEF